MAMDSDSLLVSYLFLKTFAILLAKTRFISDTHSIITAGVTKNIQVAKWGHQDIAFWTYSLWTFKLSMHVTGVTKKTEIKSWVPSEET